MVSKLELESLGSYGNRKVKMKLVGLTNRSKKLVILFPGVYGRPFRDKFYNKLFSRLSGLGVGVGTFETSRKRVNLSKDFVRYQKNFEDKSFAMEVRDVRLAVDELVSSYKEAVDLKKLELCFCGFSLGGTLSSYLISKYRKELKTLIFFGSGCETRGKKMPILSSYPEKDEILKKFKRFRGNIVVVQGTEDRVVPRDGARMILDGCKHAVSRSLVELVGADHRFRQKHGKRFNYFSLISYIIESELNKTS